MPRPRGMGLLWHILSHTMAAAPGGAPPPPLPKLPASLKPLAIHLKHGQQLEATDPVMAYHCMSFFSQVYLTVHFYVAHIR